MRGKLLAAALLLLLSGCAHVISEESRALVDPAITFSALRAAPDTYRGRYVLLGGVVAGVQNEKEGSRLEVVQTPLDSDELPEEASHSSGGRFLALSSAFLDPLVYKQGRRVTLVGQVQGKRELPIDQVQYTYPVVVIREIHVWKKSEIEQPYYPPPGYYYDPFLLPPPYAHPWWYRRPYW